MSNKKAFIYLVTIILTVFIVLCILVRSSEAATIQSLVVKSATKYVGLREKGCNQNSKIDIWMMGAGLNNKAQAKATGCGYSWCVGFVHGMYQEAAAANKIKNPLPTYAGVVNLWEYTKANEMKYTTYDSEDLISGIVKIVPGDIMIILMGRGKGHTGIFTDQFGNTKTGSIEGNTNQAGSREGDGVYRKIRFTSSIEGGIHIK